MPVKDCKILQLPKVSGEHGSISFLENMTHLPFEIKRIYYLYDVPESGVRGAHGHKKLEQLVIAVSGAFDFILDDGFEKKNVRLDQPNQGLYVCPMIWRELKNFTANTVCLVLASDFYDETDYYRDYDNFYHDALSKKLL